MKTINSLGLIFLFTLLACEQVHRTDVQISQADSAKVRFYENRSDFYQNKKPDSAIYFAEKALKLSRQLNYRSGVGLMLNRFARINEQYGNLKLALRYQQESISVFNSLHDTLASADGTASLGVLKVKEGDLITGRHLLQDALSVYKKSKSTSGIIGVYIKLGQINELSGDLGNALSYYLKAEQLSGKISLSKEYLSLLNSIGTILTKKGDHKNAFNYYERGISNSAITANNKAHITFLRKAGNALDTLGERQKALEYHHRGLHRAKESGEKEAEARLLISLAKITKDKDINQGITHLKNALSISRSIGNKALTSEIYRSMTVLYRQQSRYREALMSLEEHHRVNDSLLNALESHKIAVLQSSYDLTESKLHIETLTLANQKRTFERNVLTLTAVAISIILLILGIFFYKTNRLNKELQTSNRTKDKLFSIIGHDLRNPIGGITQLLAIMDEGGLTTVEIQQMISEMRKQSDVTLEILDALLNWGEAQLKGIHIKPLNFNANHTVIKNIEALRTQAEDKSITINDLLPKGLTIFGDANHFDFIVRNLLSNAIKFGPPSETIEIAADDQTEHGQVIFSVKDYGKGISKEQQKLFISGNLDINYGTGGEKGTGIGLMLSKEFIKANHGRIWIESGEGIGTTFYFTFQKGKV